MRPSTPPCCRGTRSRWGLNRYDTAAVAAAGTLRCARLVACHIQQGRALFAPSPPPAGKPAALQCEKTITGLALPPATMPLLPLQLLLVLLVHPTPPLPAGRCAVCQLN